MTPLAMEACGDFERTQDSKAELRDSEYCVPSSVLS